MLLGALANIQVTAQRDPQMGKKIFHFVQNGISGGFPALATT